jgi:hypothetical protein
MSASLHKSGRRCFQNGEVDSRAAVRLKAWPHLGARQCQDADWDALAQHRNPEDSAKATQPLRLRPGVVLVS